MQSVVEKVAWIRLYWVLVWLGCISSMICTDVSYMNY